MIVGDYLADPRLLRYAKPGYEIHLCREKSSCHTMKQHEISELRPKKARRGRIVARLKGGDPFVFGRGGEEIEVLRAHGVPFRRSSRHHECHRGAGPMRAFRSHIAVWQHPLPSLPDMKTRRKTNLPFTGTSWQAVSIH